MWVICVPLFIFDNEAEQGLAIIDRVTGLAPEDLSLLDLKDLQALQSYFPSQNRVNSRRLTVKQPTKNFVDCGRCSVVVWLGVYRVCMRCRWMNLTTS